MSLITYLKAWHYKLEETKITITLLTVAPSEFKSYNGFYKLVCETNSRKVIRYMKILGLSTKFVNWKAKYVFLTEKVKKQNGSAQSSA